MVDGKFDSNTNDKIAEIVKKAKYWGEFIEGFYKRNGKIFVTVGS